MSVKNNQKGVSLVELLIAGAIGCALLMYVIQFVKFNDDGNKKVMSDMEDTADNLNMESMLRRDLTNAKHSLNNLSLKDDKGNIFFDYLSSSTCTSNCKRSIKMDITNTPGEYSKKSMYFIVINQGAGEQQIFNPSDAYDRGTLNFNSLNKDGALSVRQNSPWDDSIKKRTTLMFLYSPIEIFSPTGGISSPGRTLSAMGWAGGDNFNGKLKAETINDAGSTYYLNTDLRTNKAINSEDDFFKAMPYTSGLGSFAFLTAVKIVRYRLLTVKEGSKITGQLMRAELDSGNKFNERPIGFNIKSLEFTRETISSPAIYIKTENVIK